MALSNVNTHYKVLYVNDGQDLEGLHMPETLVQLCDTRQIEPLIVVGVYANAQRTMEYGTAGIPNAQGLGAKARLYTKFLTQEVMPYINKHYRTLSGAAYTGIMGASLGGLSAFDIAWNNPHLFSRVGVFSGSFWWRTDDTNVSTKQHSRIMHKIVRQSPKREGLKMWFEAGTHDESSDRDGNGVIDAIQDTTELMDELRACGYHDAIDMTYVQIEGGRHDQATWAKALPGFLTWSFPQSH
jgi:enterochelin esterase-like enzyme